MTSNRRRSHRFAGPFEATWNGASNQRRVRVADVSLTGCFVEDLAAPAVGEVVTVTIDLPNGSPVHVSGRVVYLYPAQGFAVTFEHTEASAAALQVAVDRLSRP